MKSRIEKDKQKRIKFNLFEFRRRELKALANDTTIDSTISTQARIELTKLPRNSSPTRIRNRCIFTGRPRAVIKKFRMSRIVFREQALFGMLPGVTKASW